MVFSCMWVLFCLRCFIVFSAVSSVVLVVRCAILSVMLAVCLLYGFVCSADRLFAVFSAVLAVFYAYCFVRSVVFCCSVMSVALVVSCVMPVVLFLLCYYVQDAGCVLCCYVRGAAMVLVVCGTVTSVMLVI
jgi:hypothetical protein